jgi:hypothetical protein
MSVITIDEWVCEESAYRTGQDGLLVCSLPEGHDGRHYDDEKRRHFDT